uniref:Uncharacterized protein n=1 Tax=viral metagenome TaxID=1070528 RepID=A0A6C0ASR9_9ZZZZ
MANAQEDDAARLTPAQRAGLVDVFMLSANAGLPRVAYMARHHPERDDSLRVFSVPLTSTAPNAYAGAYAPRAHVPQPATRVEDSAAYYLAHCTGDRLQAHLVNTLKQAVDVSEGDADRSNEAADAPDSLDSTDPVLATQALMSAGLYDAARRAVRDVTGDEASALPLNAPWVRRFRQAFNGLVRAVVHQTAWGELDQDTFSAACATLRRGAVQCLVMCAAQRAQDDNDAAAPVVQ